MNQPELTEEQKQQIQTAMRTEVITLAEFEGLRTRLEVLKNNVSAITSQVNNLLIAYNDFESTLTFVENMAKEKLRKKTETAPPPKQPHVPAEKIADKIQAEANEAIEAQGE